MPRSPWWAGARLVTAGAVTAIVGMLMLNYSLRSPAPNVDGRSMPETAVAHMPVIAADDDPLMLPSATEARALVHEFMIAYEARDAAGIAALFTADGVDNDQQGVDAIRSAYERVFADLTDVTIAVPHVDSQPQGERLTITGPIVVSYRDATGAQGELRGTAQWEIARQGGTARILRLRHDVAPSAS